MSRSAPPPPREADATVLARSVAHELRQPLSEIVVCAELLATRRLPEPDRAALLAAIREAARHLAGSLARLERGGSLEPLGFGPEGEGRLLDLRP